MNDPEEDSLPVVARALRYARDARSVQSLVARLRDTDRETVTEAARALGEIGDRSAVNALLSLLRCSVDTKIVSAASGALSRMGEVGATEEIITRMLKTHSFVQRASLAISAADLLGEPGEFYKHLSKERRDRAAGFNALVQDIRAQLKRSLKTFSAERRALGHEVDALITAYEENERGATLAHLEKVVAGLSSLRSISGTGGLARAAVGPNKASWFIGLLSDIFASESSNKLQDVDLMLGVYLLSVCNGENLKNKTSDQDAQ